MDFCARKEASFTLVQVAWEIYETSTKERELRALFAAMQEMNLQSGLLITKEHEEEFHEGDKKILTIPSYKYFCLTTEEKMKLLFP